MGPLSGSRRCPKVVGYRNIDQSNIGGQLHVETGLDDDVVRLGHPTPPPSEGPAASVTDSVMQSEMMPSLRVARGVDIDLGAGHDEFFADAIKVNRGLSVNGGEGDDALHAYHAWVGGPLSLLGGGGDGADNVDVARVRAGTAAVLTGAGSDHVRIVDSVFRGLGVVLGKGDDRLDLRGNTAQWAAFLGGDDTDVLHNRDGNRFKHRFVQGFEPLPKPAAELDTTVA
ncbi:MAG: hypothetical protein JNL18_22335 [Planctomycetaceae bacterium]|nr:hypothetical protein [Planctomycetaceae bacterium]